MQTIGKRLAEIRKSRKFKQIELAEMLNVSQQVISNIERDVTAPDIEQLKKFADIYNISLDQLVGREFFGGDADNVERRIIDYVKQMDKGSCYTLKMGISKQNILERIYEASNWVTFINPKVDLNYLRVILVQKTC